MVTTQLQSDSRAAYYARIAQQHLAPLWEVLHALVPQSPRPTCVAAHWRYRDVRPLVLESGGVISAEEAVRRVLILENPACPGAAQITRSLYAGLQLILPGEVAPGHRHTQSAMRFILEGAGAFTAVDGERAYMNRGDLILTPNWTFHDHGHEGVEPMIWLDALDIPMVEFFGAGFAESLGAKQQAQSRQAGESLARYGANLLPVDHVARSRTSPMFCYPYERTRAALDTLARAADIDPCHGVRLKYANPVNGEHAVPTMAAFIQWMPQGFAGRTYRSTDGCVYVCVEGRGRTRIGDQTFAWEPNDVFVVPSWAPYSHQIDADCVLFSYSDRAAQEKLDLWREERAAAVG